MMRARSVLFISIILFSCSSESNYLPSEIFDISLKKKLTGDAAEEFINRLHFENVADAQTEIGFYEGEPGEAVIYLTYYSSSEQAFKYGQQMTGKISAENTPFIMGEYLDIEGKQIYRTFGMGQTHFVFSHDNVLIWLSLGTSWANDFLKDYLRYIS